jgi:uncharacterized Zn finger protein (UPF0148 family)
MTAACPHCNRPLPAEVIRNGDVACPVCRGEFRLLTFNPTERRARRSEQAGLTPDAKAVCGNHPRNVAAHGCGRCGMFICSLCAIEADGMILCPGCYERLTAEGALTSSRMKFRDMGGLASTAAALGIFLWFFCMIAGPMAIAYGIKALRQRKEFGESISSWRVWIAMLIGLAETVGGVLLIMAVAGAFGK